MLCKEAAVKGEDLEDIDHRIAGKARGAGRQHDVSRGAGKLDITGNRDDDNCLNPAAVEGVTSTGRRHPGSERRGPGRSAHQISPRCNAASIVAGRLEYNSFKRSVTEFICRRSRNSAIAMA
jgi:hypothetical protein